MQTNWRNNENSPCHNCDERFIACSGRCPKDERGDFGYKAWLEKVHAKKARYNEYLRARREERKRSEEYEYKNRRKRG